MEKMQQVRNHQHHLPPWHFFKTYFIPMLILSFFTDADLNLMMDLGTRWSSTWKRLHRFSYDSCRWWFWYLEDSVVPKLLALTSWTGAFIVQFLKCSFSLCRETSTLVHCAGASQDEEKVATDDERQSLGEEIAHPKKVRWKSER